MEDPATWTPEYLIATGARMYLWCEACRITRTANILALNVAGRGKQPVARMKFRCSTCAALGRPTTTSAVIDWFEDGRNHSFNAATGMVKSR